MLLWTLRKSIPLERIDDRQDRLKIDPKCLFLLYHSGLTVFSTDSLPVTAPSCPRSDVNAEGGVETLQITALSGSDGKVQALDLTRRTQQLLQQGSLLLLLLLLRRMMRVSM